MLAPHERQTDSRLTIKDLDIYPKYIDRVFIGFNLTNLIFLPCCDQQSSSGLFDKICGLSRKLGIRPLLERYIPFNEDRPLIIISKNDFKLLFNVPAEKIHVFSEEDNQHLFYHLLGNRSLLGADQSLKNIFTRLSQAIALELEPIVNHPTDWQSEPPPAASADTSKNDTQSKSNKRNHLQLSGDASSDESYPKTFFAKPKKSEEGSDHNPEPSPLGVQSSPDWDAVLAFLADDLDPDNKESNTEHSSNTK